MLAQGECVYDKRWSQTFKQERYQLRIIKFCSYIQKKWNHSQIILWPYKAKMGVCNCSMFCWALLYVQSSYATILMGRERERESWLLCFVWLPGASWLMCGSSSRCHGFVCKLWIGISWSYSLFLTYIYNPFSINLNLSTALTALVTPFCVFYRQFYMIFYN